MVTNACPYCEGLMRPTRMTCDACAVAVEADFPLSRLSRLPTEHQQFVEMFVLAGGSLKTIAEQTGVSYPTVRSRLDKVIAALRDEIGQTAKVRGTVLDAVDKDNAKPGDAAKLIKRI